MRKAFSTAAVVLGLFALLAPTAATAPNSQRVASLTIRLIGSVGHFKVRDRAPQGPSKGDVYAGPSVLRNAVKQFRRAKGAVVGHDYEVLTLTSPTTERVRAVAYLPGGTIRVRGYRNRQTNPRAFTVSVVGGTGRYANSRGTVYVRDVSPTSAVNVYHLRIP
jgi:hypothetical protein